MTFKRNTGGRNSSKSHGKVYLREL